MPEEAAIEAGAFYSMAKDVPVLVPNQDRCGSWFDPEACIRLAFVADGCGEHGAAVSARVKNLLLELFQDAVAWCKGSHVNCRMDSVARRLVTLLAAALENEADLRSARRGATLTLMIACGGWATFANVGNSRYMLYDAKGGLVHASDPDLHCPSNEQELERLEGEGSAFRGKNHVRCGRLYDAEMRGGLNLSRLLGFKSLADSGLIPDPHVASFSLGSIGSIVLCTKGVVPADVDVGSIVAKGRASGQSIEATAEKIVEGARRRLRIGCGSADVTERGFFFYDATALVFSVRAP